MEKSKKLVGPIIHDGAVVSESIAWHAKKSIPISLPVYRWSSIEHINMMSEARI